VFTNTMISWGCRKFEVRFEDYLEGAADPELEAHIASCAHCRAAVEDARLAGELLREAWGPVPEGRESFAPQVMSRIAREETRAASPAAFWAPLEFLASRVSLTAAMVLLALSFYLKFAPHRFAVPGNRAEVTASDFPQPPTDPVSNEEVLQSLAERNYGR
jgi:anti-sigma factor RsiW